MIGRSRDRLVEPAGDRPARRARPGAAGRGAARAERASAWRNAGRRSPARQSVASSCRRARPAGRRQWSLVRPAPSKTVTDTEPRRDLHRRRRPSAGRRADGRRSRAFVRRAARPGSTSTAAASAWSSPTAPAAARCRCCCSARARRPARPGQPADRARRPRHPRARWPRPQLAAAPRLPGAARSRTRYPGTTVLNHEWWDPATFVVARHHRRRPGRRAVRRPAARGVDVRLNRAVVEHDVALVVGPVFPHEVVGFSGGNKYFFPGRRRARRSSTCRTGSAP